MTAVIPAEAGIQRFGSGYAGLGGRIGWWGAPCPVTGGSGCAHRPGKPGHHPLDRPPVSTAGFTFPANRGRAPAAWRPPLPRPRGQRLPVRDGLPIPAGRLLTSAGRLPTLAERLPIPAGRPSPPGRCGDSPRSPGRGNAEAPLPRGDRAPGASLCRTCVPSLHCVGRGRYSLPHRRNPWSRGVK